MATPAPSHDGAPSVAFDTGPLHGRRTGIGNAVAWTLDALRADRGVELQPYLTSARARVEPGERRLPLPAAVAHRWWARSALPPMDRWLGHPDVVHGTNYVVPPARCGRAVSVYDCWFLGDDVSPAEIHPDVRRAGAALRRAVADGAHVVTSSTATTARVRSLLGAEHVHTVLLGPPPALPAPTVPPSSVPTIDGPFILALGSVERRKNLPTLVDAFARVAREHPDVRLVVAGPDGDDSAAVSTAITRIDPRLAARIVRTGPVDDEAKQWLLHHARVLAYPSLDEGFGFPILEAQQHGTPVVASTAGSIPEVAGGAALLSPPRNVDALAANLHWVVTNDEMHAKLAERGRRNVVRFSWAATARRLVGVYRELAEPDADR